MPNRAISGFFERLFDGRGEECHPRGEWGPLSAAVLPPSINRKKYSDFLATGYCDHLIRFGMVGLPDGRMQTNLCGTGLLHPKKGNAAGVCGGGGIPGAEVKKPSFACLILMFL